MQLPFDKIHSKYQFYSLSLVLLAAGLGLLFYVHSLRVDAYHQYQSQLDKLPLIYAKVHQAEQKFRSDEATSARFLKTGQSKYLDEYEQNFRRFQKNIQYLEQNSISQKLGQTEGLNQIHLHIKQHRKYTQEFASKIKQIGKDDVGLEGVIQKDFEKLQQISQINPTNLVILQKFKNDFLLYKDLNAIAHLKRETFSILDMMRGKINVEDSLGRKKMAGIVKDLEIYTHSINRLVNLNKEIGLDAQTGIRAELNEEHLYLDKNLTLLQENAEAKLGGIINESQSFVWTIFLIALFITALLSLVISKVESSSLVSLDRIVKSLKLGIRNQEKLLNHPIFHRRDEVGSIAKNFQYFIAKFKVALGQIKEKDLKLEEAAHQESLRNWNTEGLNLLKDIFSKHHHNTDQQNFEVISELVKYTRSHQGGLFILNQDASTPQLELKACYAYERQKYKKKTVEIGEGLVGTAWKENKTLFITDVPPNYTHIASALSKTAPNSLLIVPLKVEEEIVGVVELISLRSYEAHEIEFVEMATSRIASALMTTQASAKNRKLLETTEQIAQEAQEKEVKLQEQIKNYQYWLQEFENKLKRSTDSNEIYQSILNKMYRGMIVTNEKFRIVMVNDFILKRFNHQEANLLNQPLEMLLDTDYENILDLRERKLKLNPTAFEKNPQSKIIDKRGKAVAVESVSGKLEIEDKVVYIFLLNEQATETRSQQNNGNSKLKVAS